MYTLYILQCADGTLYTGITKNLKQRLIRHRSGKGSKYVRSRLPVNIVYTKKQKNLSKAMKREIAIKKLSRKKKLLLCNIKR